MPVKSSKAAAFLHPNVQCQPYLCLHLPRTASSSPRETPPPPGKRLSSNVRCTKSHCVLPSASEPSLPFSTCVILSAVLKLDAGLPVSEGPAWSQTRPPCWPALRCLWVARTGTGTVTVGRPSPAALLSAAARTAESRLSWGHGLSPSARPHGAFF